MPRLTQEALDQARSLEGSVFDDTWSQLLRLGTGDSMGGLSANPTGGMGVGIVRNETHPAFRMLQKVAPREAEHLQKSPAIVRYANTSPKELSEQGLNAVTIPIGGEQAQKIVQAGGFRGVNIPVSAFQEMANTPGSSLQLYPRRTPISGSTTLHEAGHALRLARTGGEAGMPNIPPLKAVNILQQALQAGVFPPGDYKGDYLHATLAALSNLRAGGFRIR